MDPLTLLTVGVVSVSAALFCLQSLRTRPKAGLLLCVFGATLAWEFPASLPVATVGGTSAYAADLIALLLLAAAINAALSTGGHRSITRLLSFGLLAMFTASLIIGALEFGTTTAVVEARPPLWTACVLAWAMSVDWSTDDNRRALTLTFIFGTWLLAAVTIYHIVVYGLGTADSIIEYHTPSGIIEQIGRPLVKGQAAFLALAVTYLASVRLDRLVDSRRLANATLVCALVVLVISQQRTAIAATAVAVLVAALVDPRLRRLGAALVTLVGLTLIYFAGTSGSSVSNSEFISRFFDDSTYAAREEGWRALLSQVESLQDVIIGNPFGSGFDRVQSGVLIELSPHNWYLTVFLRAGLLGLTLLIALLFVQLRRSFRARQGAALAGLVVLLVMGWTYGWEWFYVFALALGAQRRSTTSSDEALAEHEARQP